MDDRAQGQRETALSLRRRGPPSTRSPRLPAATTPLAHLRAHLPPPDRQQLFAALRGNQAETDRFFGTLAGTVPLAEFYAPENVQRIVAA